MIHYHGTPVTSDAVAVAFFKARHACVSFANPAQLALVAELCQSFILDNGAYTQWTAGEGRVDPVAYAAWVAQWHRHPGYDWCLIPDVIDGDEHENDRMLAAFYTAAKYAGLDWRHCVPVWHLHESLDRLRTLAHSFPRVALGSSGQFAEVGTPDWWGRMSEAMDTVCDEDGRPLVRLHGLRMLNPTVFSQLPLASADSTNVARNIGLDSRWDRAAYAPRSKAVRALVLADRIEHHASAARWTDTRGVAMNWELFG